MDFSEFLNQLTGIVIHTDVRSDVLCDVARLITRSAVYREQTSANVQINRTIIAQI